MQGKHLGWLGALSLMVAAVFYLAWPDSPPARALDRGWNALRQTVARSGGTEVHKCVSASQTVYSSDKCPSGSRELPVKQGTLTVVPATPVAAPASAASVPTLRDLLAPPGEPNLQEQRIERTIGS